jgi:hypothetical protein
MTTRKPDPEIVHLYQDKSSIISLHTLQQSFRKLRSRRWQDRPRRSSA